MADANITAPIARAIFDYEPETGVIRWKISIGKAIAGQVAGSLRAYGYWGVSYKGCNFLAHRLAFLLTNGTFPAADVDHINGNRLDNRWCNLREVSRAVNLQNKRTPRADNKCGFLGVHQIKVSGKWRARVQLNGRTYEAGCHATPELAHEAYLTLKRKIHEGCTI